MKKKAIKALALTLAGLAAGAGVTGGVVAAVKKSNEEKANTPINHEEENTNQELPIDNTDPVVQTLEVTFDLNQGEGEIATQQVAENQKAERPANNPSRTGYEFLDWYLNETQFDFNTPITNDITLQAKWIKLHTVTFNNNGVETSTTVRDHETVTATTPNDREGYEFGGWYLGETEFNFDTPITDDITLQAKWDQIVLQTRGTLNQEAYFNIENGVLCGLTEAGKNYAARYETLDVVIPDSVRGIYSKAIAESAFADCSAFVYFLDEGNYNDFGNKVVSVHLPNRLTTIGVHAFYNCSRLRSIIVPENVTTIGEGAFSDCEYITYYCEAESKPEGWNDNWYCYEAEIYWGNQWEYVNGEPTPCADADFQYEKVGDNYRITKCIASGYAVIPETYNGGTVTEIADDAFSDCDYLDTIYCPFERGDYDWIPDYDKVFFQGEWTYEDDGDPMPALVGDQFFDRSYGYDSLAGLTQEAKDFIERLSQNGWVVVVIPDGVTSIYGREIMDGCHDYPCSAFTYDGFDYGCVIDEVIFPESLTYIGDYALYGCENISMDIPDGVEVSDLAYGAQS